MAGKFSDIIGTSFSRFRLGLAGPWVKNSSGIVQARNAADADYAPVAAALFQTFGNDFELNSGAAGSGADWKMTVRRPSTGMTMAVVIVMPASGTPTVGQALTVASVAAGVVTLQYTTIAAGTEKVVCDTTALAFGSSSPVTAFTLPIAGIVKLITAIVDTPFTTGTPALSVGVAGTTAKYMPTSAVDLTAAAGTAFEYHPNLPADGTTNDIILTYAAGGVTAGAGRVLIDYVIPS